MRSDSIGDNDVVIPFLPEHEYALNELSLDAALRKRLNIVKDCDTCYVGYMEGGMEKCNDFLKHLKHLGYRFSVRNSITKENPRLTFSNCTHKLYIQSFGPVFSVTRYYNMVCIRGVAKKLETNKRSGCSAELNIKIIKYFPKYAVSKDAKLRQKFKVMSRLKADLHNPICTIEYSHRVYVSISKQNAHNHKPIMNAGRNKHQRDNEESIEGQIDFELSQYQNDQELSEKQSELKILSQYIATLSDCLSDKDVLDKSIARMREILEEMGQPFGIIAEIGQ